MATAADGPLFEYRARVEAGALRGDPAQELAAEKLQSLWHALAGYQPRRGASWKERFGLARRAEEPPQGLYIFGDVGRGKSMLMDLFFAAAPVAAKRRVHFHEFMLEIHARLHAKRQGEANGKRVDDLLGAVAAEIAEGAWLLCFDELFVANVADAMLLGRLFQALFERGVIVVATSNVAPDALYAGGLQRELFVPFIALVKQRLDVLHLEGRQDYRLARLMSTVVYHVPLGPAATRALDRAFADLTDNAPAGPETVPVLGRVVSIPKAAKGVARFHYDELCRRPLAAADYLALAERYHSFVVDGIPRLAEERRDEAKRLAILIDTLYEKRARLICAAEAAPDRLYPAGDHAFEFRRAASRLMEMQSAEYLQARRTGAA